MKQLLKRQMKDVPAAEQEKVLGMLEKNPELFQKIAVEIQELMKQGKDQMTATMEVAQRYQSELKDVMK